MLTNTIPIPENTELQDCARESLAIYLLPTWIYQAFTAKYNLMEIHSYGKLRDVLSLTDVAHLEILRTNLFKKNQISKLNQVEFSYTLRSFIDDRQCSSQATQEVTSEERQEIESTIRHLMIQDEVIEEALGRFKKPESMYGDLACSSNYWTLTQQQPEQETPLYRIVNSQDKLYIIVEEGFLSQMETAANLKTFLTQVLKSAYAIASIPVVNSTLWYKQYLSVLAAEA